jgi:hypothetical protein
MGQNTQIGQLTEVVALLERAAPLIELADTTTAREALEAMRSGRVGFARIVRAEDDMVRSALVSADDLRRLESTGARRLADGFDRLPGEVMIDWLDLLGNTARDALADHPDARLVSVEDSGELLGVLPVELVVRVPATAPVSEESRGR